MLMSRYKNYRNIAFRFLKDTGLFPYWKRYMNIFQLPHEPYEKQYAEYVFGCTCFTDFLSQETGLKEPYTKVFEYFIWWLDKEGLAHKYDVAEDNMQNVKNSRHIDADIRNFYEKIKES